MDILTELREKIDKWRYEDQEVDQQQVLDSFIRGAQEIEQKYNASNPDAPLKAVVFDTQAINAAETSEERIEIVRQNIQDQHPEIYAMLQDKYGADLDSKVLEPLVSNGLGAQLMGPSAQIFDEFSSEDMAFCAITSAGEKQDTLRDDLRRVVPMEFRIYPENAPVSNEAMNEGTSRHETIHCTDDNVQNDDLRENLQRKTTFDLGAESFADGGSYEGHPEYAETKTAYRAISNFFRSEESLSGPQYEAYDARMFSHSTTVSAHNEEYLPAITQMQDNVMISEIMHKGVMTSQGFDNIEQARDLLKSDPAAYADAAEQGLLKYDIGLSDDLKQNIQDTSNAIRMFLTPDYTPPSEKINTDPEDTVTHASIDTTPLAQAQNLETQSTNPQSPVAAAIVPTSVLTVAQADGSSKTLQDMQPSPVSDTPAIPTDNGLQQPGINV
tara:strand:+ start:414 stop:1736 length:1323 start_codon:yes stop_codon:yes gene_type:complete